jgi:sulfonate transport system substrate-binding protein
VTAEIQSRRAAASRLVGYMSFRRILSVVCGLMLSFVTALPVRAETSPKVIRIGVPGAVSLDGKPVAGGAYGPETARLLKGAFKRPDIEIRWVNIMSAGPGINEAFASGAIDFADYGDLPSIIAKAGGIDIKYLVPLTRGMDSYLIVPPASTAKSIVDLKGKRIGINHGRPWELAFARLLGANGLTQSDFQIFNLNLPDGDAALAAHNIDGLYSLDAYQDEARGIGKIIWSTRSEPLTWKLVAGLFSTASFAKDYPETTQQLVTAFVSVNYYFSQPEHREEALRTTALGQGLTYDEVEKAYLGVSIKERNSVLFDPVLYAYYKDAIAYAFKTRLIRRPFAAEDLLEPAFSQEALRQLKLEHYWTPYDADGKPISSTDTGK